MKILFYAINGIGLGHLNKLILVAREVRVLRPDCTILFITNTEFTDMLSGEKFQYIKLPLNEKDVVMSPFSKTIPIEDYNRFIMLTLDFYMPQVVVYDAAFPAEVTRYAAARGIKNVFIMRKDKPARFHAILNSGILQNFAYVCLPYSRKEFTELGSDDKTLRLVNKGKIEFIGPILKRSAPGTRRDGTFRVVVAAGGGGWHDSERLIAHAYKACQNLVENKGVECRILTGPYYRGNISSSDPKIIIEKFRRDLMGILKSADIVVSQSGYSMCNEIVASGTPAILCPGFRFNEDTLGRAKRLEQKGVAITVNNPSKIGKTLMKLYKNKKLLQRMRLNFRKMKIVPGNARMAGKIVELAENTVHCNLDGKKGLPKNAAGKNIIFTGSIRSGILEKIRLAKKKKCNVIQLHSNAPSLSNPETIKKLADAGISSFMLDIYSDKEHMHDRMMHKKNNFRRMISALKELDMENIHCVCNLVITKENRSRLTKMVRLLFRLNVFQVQINLKNAKNADLSAQIVLLRKLKTKPAHLSRIVYFCSNDHPPDAVNISRFYTEQISHYGLRIRECGQKKTGLLESKKIYGAFQEYDKKLNHLKSRFSAEYAASNAIEMRIGGINDKLQLIAKPSGRNAGMVRQLQNQAGRLMKEKEIIIKKFGKNDKKYHATTATLDTLKANRTISRLRVLEHETGKAPMDERKKLLGKGIVRSYLKVMAKKEGMEKERDMFFTTPLSRIDASIQSLEREIRKRVGSQKKHALIKKLELQRDGLDEMLRKHQREKIKWLKRGIADILSQKERLLKKTGLHVKFRKIGRDHELYEGKTRMIRKKLEALSSVEK